MSNPPDLSGLLEWRCIGPFRGGRVVAVAGDPYDAATFYFGAVAGGVWKTTDAGQYWQCISDGAFKTGSVGALEVAPADPSVIYAGMGETTIRIDVSHGDGVYKSTDAGRTWRHIGLADTRHIGKIRTHPDNPDIVFVAALGHAFGPNEERGVYKSTDGGANWRKVLYVNDKAGAVDLSIDKHNPRFVYSAIWPAYRSFSQISSGGPDSAIWMSSDGGESWQNINDRPGLPRGLKGKIAVAASPVQSGRVWALIEHRSEGGLYRSDDYGATWQYVSNNQNLVSRAWYYIHLTADTVDADTVYVNNLDLWKSIDGGSSWTEIATPHGDNHDLWIDPINNRRMIQGNDGGACVSLNGGESWSTIYNQPTAQFYHIAADTRSPYYVYGTQQDNTSIAVPSRTHRNAIGWTDCFIAGSGESGYITVRPDNPDIVYVGAIGSSPGGGNALQRYDHSTKQLRLITTWPEAMGGYGSGEHKYRFNWTYPIVISPHDPNTLYIGGNLVFRSTDEGQSWQPISPDLSRADPETLKITGGPVNKDSIGAEVYATVFSLVESAHAKGELWAGSDDGVMHISRDGGDSWQPITPPDLPEFAMISGIELSPFAPGTAYVAATRYKLDDYRPYLYKTSDYGATWSRIDAGIPEDDFTRVVRADPLRQGLLFCGTETGVYISFDDGANWTRMQSNLPVSPIHDLLIKDANLIAGTHGRSIWILDDLTPLRELPAELGAAHIFNSQPAIRNLIGVDWTGNAPGKNYVNAVGGAFVTKTTDENNVERIFLDMGTNPPRGALIGYYLAEAPNAPISLTISDSAGNVLRTFTSKAPAPQPLGPAEWAGGEKPQKQSEDPTAKELKLPAKAGFNRFVWDLRIESATRIEGNDPPSEGRPAGPRVPPGTYTLTLKVGDTTLSRELSVIKEPSIATTDAEIQAQYALSLRIFNKVDETRKTINRMRGLRGQLDGWAKRAGGLPNGPAVAEAATALRDKVLEIEKTLQVPDLRSGWADNLNEGTRLLDKLQGLAPVLELGEYRPTDAAQAVYDSLSAQIDEQIGRFNALVEAAIPSLNARINEANLGAITL
ncbi:MAG: glycosyl hydrolase [Oscillochloris sp.]|nr:glycosyl hydrolase [Oscillochloris sp.]